MAQSKRRPALRHRCLQVECLEPRSLLATAAVSAGNLIINDTSGNDNDAIVVSLVGNTVRIVDTSTPVVAGAGAAQVNANTVDVLLASITGSIQVNTLSGDDLLDVNLFSGRTITYDGGSGTDSLIGSGAATTTWNIVQPGSGSATLLFSSFTGVENITGSSVADIFVFGSAGSLSGTINGGGGTDTLDYSALSTPVAVNLGLGSTGLIAKLDGTQEVPAQETTATATATITNYNALTKTFDISLTASNINPADVNGFHIDRGPFGVNGPVLIDLMSLGPLVPSGSGFTFAATGVSLANSLPGGATNEAAFLGGLTYLNIHTTAFSDGQIRGQIFSSGNVNLAAGTATGTGSISNIENVKGGTVSDGLIGSFLANTLSGNAGDDTLVGAPGNDTIDGGAGDDTLVWSNGDNNDVMDGGTNTAVGDRMNINGSPAGDDAFKMDAGAGGRIDFARTNLVPFALNIGTSETVTVNGIDGSDLFTIDFTEGNTIPSGGVAFNGGDSTTGPGDKLMITGADQGTVTYNYANSHDGSIAMSNKGTVIYTGLNSIFDNSSTIDVVVNLPSGPNVVTLSDDGVSGNSMSRLSGGTFTTTDFVNPTNPFNPHGTLTINRGDAADTLTVNALPDFNSGLTIGSEPNSFAAATFAGAVTLASGNDLRTNAGTVAVNSTLTGTLSQIILLATGDISFSGGKVQTSRFVATADRDANGSGTFRQATPNDTITASSLVAIIAADVQLAAAIDAAGGVAMFDASQVGAPIHFAEFPAITGLTLSDSGLDLVTAATLQIGTAASGPITVDQNITRPAATQVRLTSGAAINFSGGSLNTGGGNLTLAPGSTASVSAAKTGIDIDLGLPAALGGVLDFAAGSDLAIAINGPAVDSQYNQLNVVGQVKLTGVDLVLSGAYVPAFGDNFVIVNNDGSDAILGVFNGLPEGAIVNVNGVSKFITYVGGVGGNDVVLVPTSATPPTGITAYLANDALIVVGTGLSDNIVIDQLGGPAAAVRVLDNGNPVFAFASSAVNRANVFAGNGNDSITIDASFGARPTVLKGEAGADSYQAAGGNDTIYGDAADASAPTPKILGGAGNDFLNFQDETIGLTFNNQGAQTGGFEAIWSGSGNDTITNAGGTTGVQLIGWAGNDTLTGGEGNDLINGADGDDVLVGNGGDDELNGTDIGLGANSGQDRFDGGAGNDIVRADALDMNPVGRKILGGGPSGFGADPLGGATHKGDFLDLSLVPSGTNLTFNDDMGAAATDIGGWEDIFLGGGNDSVTVTNATAADGIYLVGFDGDDVLVGGPGPDTLQGVLGNDRLIGLGGADQFIGGQGIDTVDYSTSRDASGNPIPPPQAPIPNYPGFDGVVVDLRPLGKGFGNEAAGDFSISQDIENIIGTPFSDYLIGNVLDNVVDGLAGNDGIVGDQGNDSLTGGLGNDELTGSDGLVFTDFDRLDGGAGDDTIYADGVDLTAGFIQGVPTVTLVSGGSGVDFIDFVFSSGGINFVNDFNIGANRGGFENVFGNRTGNDNIFTVGPAPNLQYVGWGGDDTLIGGSGNDILNGADGNDTLTGNGGADQFVGGNDADTAMDFNAGQFDQKFSIEVG